MAEEHEIEEGEIFDGVVYSYSDLKIPKEEDEVEIYDDSHIDIDAKIQSVLGDYMKGFEGAVSAENLGQKFGVHGSFLPIDQLVRVSSSDNTAAPKSSDLHTASDNLHCPELTTYGDKPPVAPFTIQGDSIRCSKGSVDVKEHNGREVSVKKRKSREQDYLGNELGESDVNAFESKFRKQKKSKVIQTEKKKSSRSKGEGKSTRRDTGIKDSAPKEREQQANKYRVKHQSEAESGMIRKPVYKKAIGYGKVARAYIAYW
uniref:Zinc ion binding n=1 Tax=Solanum tuberosum TaxID=4113 RepID=M0ZQF0_SOLTU